MNVWKTGSAKQHLSEVLRRCQETPQEIYNRERLVAAVISADVYEEFEAWRRDQGRRTLGEAFQEVRELCREYDFELEAPERVDRDPWKGEER